MLAAKFNLAWDKFNENISESLEIFQQENNFCDVTLVSDDEQMFTAHKVVLSASSEFFKNILQKSTHSSTLFYVFGVPSEMLQNIITYLYKGEVELPKDHFEDFMVAAQKLKIKGLMKEDEEETIGNLKKEPELLIDTNDKEIMNDSNITFEEVEHEKSVEENNDNVDVRKKRRELILKNNDGSQQCKVCSKVSTNKSNMSKHVELHLTGISYDCKDCGKSFKNRSALYYHQHKKACLNSNKIFI